jgi:hypothetical protein
MHQSLAHCVCGVLSASVDSAGDCLPVRVVAAVCARTRIVRALNVLVVCPLLGKRSKLRCPAAQPEFCPSVRPMHKRHVRGFVLTFNREYPKLPNGIINIINIIFFHRTWDMTVRFGEIYLLHLQVQAVS